MTDNEEEGVWKWSSTGKIRESPTLNYYYAHKTSSENEEISKSENCAFMNAYLPDMPIDREGPPFSADLKLNRVKCSEELNIICEKE